MELSKRDLRKERNKQAIKEAALKIAEKEGWQGVTIRKIADQILYTPPVVYEHFKNKDDLYRHLVKDGFDYLTKETLKAMQRVNTPEEKLLKLAEVRFDFIIKNPTLHHIMFVDLDDSEWQKRELIKATGEIRKYCMELLTEISGDPGKASEYFLNMICLIRGYVYFKSKEKMAKRLKADFICQPKGMKILFINAVKRFLLSIKSNQ